MLTLLLQLNGDLPDKFPAHERKLYIFSCRRKACRKKEGTVRAIRGTRISKSSATKSKANSNVAKIQHPPKQEKPPPNLGDSLFNSTRTSGTSNQNPFSSSAPRSPLTNPFSQEQPSTTTSLFPSLASKPPQNPTPDLPTTFAQKARISSPPPSPTTKSAWPPQSSLPKPYPSYHLDADYETLDAETTSTPKTAMDIDTSGSSTKDDEKDAFESTIDKTFQKFADRLAQNPEQVLRYEFGGTPLLYSKTDTVGKLFSPTPTETSSNSKLKTTTQKSTRIPHCPNCASPRVFELQLVPHAIAELEVEEEGLEGMEWGTVLLCVCERDCGERGVEDGDVGWVEEWVGVQWEESGEVRKG